MAGLKPRHLNDILLADTLDERAQPTFLLRAIAQNAVAKRHALRFQLPTGFNRHMQAFFSQARATEIISSGIPALH